MDHVLEAMQPHYDAYFSLFLEEHREKKHRKLAENVYYEEVKALIDAMNILRKYLGWKTVKLSEEVNWRLEG